MAKQFLSSLECCHKMGISHKDLKLENIMLDSKLRPTLIDFGFCEFASKEEQKSVRWVGTPDYAAPEIILKKPYCGYKADIYSAGVVLFCLLTGVLPFDLKRKCEILWAGKKPIIAWDDPSLPTLSKPCRDLLSSMLETDPEIRPDIQQVLKHKWLKKRLFF